MQELSTFTSEMHLSEQMFIVYLFTIFTTACIPDSILTKEILVLTTRKLTPLIGIDYRRYSIPSDSFFYRVKNRSCVKRVR